MSATATTPDAGLSDVGDTWLIGVAVTDDVDGQLVDADVTVVVTLPDATTVPAAAANTRVGHYVATHVVTVPGRHTAVASVSGAVVSVVTFATFAAEPGALPTLVDVQEYLGASAPQFTDVQLTNALAAEAANQALVCRVGAVYPPDLRAALLRRVQRALALRTHPLAVLLGDAEGGSTIIPGNDPEVRRLEGPHRRKLVFA